MMPLRDHFHPPLYPSRSWESFHARWANSIGDYLNQILPPRYVSEVLTHLGTQVEADVAEFEAAAVAGEEMGNGAAGEGRVTVQTWSPPAATMLLPAVFPDDLKVQVIDQRDDSRLVGVVELVSPRNKDRPDARRAFAAKGAAYLQQGIGLVVVDIVTGRHANMHNELVELLELAGPFRMPADALLYAVAYRPVHRTDANQVEAWPHRFSVGDDLPVVPLALRGARPIPLDLNTTYEDACRRARL